MMLELLKKIKARLDRVFMPFIKMCFYNTFCKAYIELFGRKDKREMKYRLSLCLIFKNEAPFLKEWIDYHTVVGVDHFYLYNNNSDDNYKEVLDPYIRQGIVTLIEWPYQNSQFKAYKHCYENFRNETNWVSFLDADEFFVPKYELTIIDWLSRFAQYPAIVIHWTMFGTGGQMKHDYSTNVIEQYFTCWDHFYPLGKCIINTRFDISNYDIWHVHHHTYMKYPICGKKITLPAINQFGYMCLANHKIWGCKDWRYDKATMFCNHYYTKAWDMYSAKMKRTDVLFAEAPRAKINQFYKMENNCTSKDYTISRFYIRLKIKQGIIKL